MHAHTPTPTHTPTHPHPRSLGLAFLDGAASSLVDQAYSDAAQFSSSPEGRRVATVGWVARRVYALMLYVSLVWLVVGAESLMEWLGNEGGGIGRTPCSDITNTVGGMALFPSLLVLYLLYGVRQVRRWRDGAGGSGVGRAACLVLEFVGGAVAVSVGLLVVDGVFVAVLHWDTAV